MNRINHRLTRIERTLDARIRALMPVCSHTVLERAYDCHVARREYLGLSPEPFAQYVGGLQRFQYENAREVLATGCAPDEAFCNRIIKDHSEDSPAEIRRWHTVVKETYAALRQDMLAGVPRGESLAVARLQSLKAGPRALDEMK